VPESLAFMDVR